MGVVRVLYMEVYCVCCAGMDASACANFVRGLMLMFLSEPFYHAQ